MINTNETKWTCDSATGCLYENGVTAGKLITGNSGAWLRLITEANHRAELVEALQNIDVLTRRVALMSNVVQATFDRNPDAEKYRCEINGLILEIRSQSTVILNAIKEGK